MEYSELFLFVSGFLAGFAIATICDAIDSIMYDMKLLSEEKERLHIDNRLKNRLKRKLSRQTIDKTDEIC